MSSEDIAFAFTAFNALLSGMCTPWAYKVLRLRIKDDAVLGGGWGALSYLFFVLGVFVSSSWRIAQRTTVFSPGTVLISLALVFGIVFMLNSVHRARLGKPVLHYEKG